MQSSWRTCVLNTPPPVSQSFSISARARSCFAPLLRSWAYTRMLVSTKHLSLMQFAARTGAVQPRSSPTRSRATARLRARSYPLRSRTSSSSLAARSRLIELPSSAARIRACFRISTSSFKVTFVFMVAQFRVQHNSTCWTLSPSTPLSLLVDIRPAKRLLARPSLRGDVYPDRLNAVRDFNAALFLDVAPDLDEVERGFRRTNVAPCHSGLAFRSAR